MKKNLSIVSSLITLVLLLLALAIFSFVRFENNISRFRTEDGLGYTIKNTIENSNLPEQISSTIQATEQLVNNN